MRRGVVENDVQLSALVATVEGLEETQEVVARVPLGVVPDALAGGQFKSCKETGETAVPAPAHQEGTRYAEACPCALEGTASACPPSL